MPSANSDPWGMYKQLDMDSSLDTQSASRNLGAFNQQSGFDGFLSGSGQTGWTPIDGFRRSLRTSTYSWLERKLGHVNTHMYDKCYSNAIYKGNVEHKYQYGGHSLDLSGNSGEMRRRHRGAPQVRYFIVCCE
ncbi:hypothetical protein DPMN_039946 [Dreissena polymorpha]|uniref:Uncharacterized protein n=1 Tax=Dreissena polymorpha TaxID=45954 RepID=A0A9D4CUB2_DREPO|nr:hypothetical protein DPMN_039946 [Dreissena polymorpha]